MSNVSKPKYDFAKFPRKYPATVRYSAISHVRGHLHMRQLRFDTFCILMGHAPDETRTLLRPHVYEWTMADQAKLIEKALSECPLLGMENPVAA